MAGKSEGKIGMINNGKWVGNIEAMDMRDQIPIGQYIINHICATTTRETSVSTGIWKGRESISDKEINEFT